jgi:hypothetical protein
MPSITFQIDRDGELFSHLKLRAQRDVLKRLRALKKIAASKSLAAGCRTVMADFAGQRGYSQQRFYKLFRAYMETGDWKCLVNKSLAGPRWYAAAAGNNLPDAFLDFVASEWALAQRDKFLAVHQRIVARLDRWRRGDETAALPGFVTPPPADTVKGLPKGWSYDNMKIAVEERISKFSRTLVQRGPKAAYLGHAPHIISTRVGTEVGEYYLVDDSWNDFKVVAFGQTVRLLSFHILDLTSGHNCKRGYKPALTDEHDIERRLQDKEMIWLTTAHLQAHGYRTAGTTFICEKATGTIKPEVEEILVNFGLPIAVQRGPRGGGPGIDALFTGPGGGNPRWKAPLESHFNLVRNRTDHLLEFPGQTGSYSSGLPMPEGLAGLERDTKALIEAARALPLERAELLQLGMLNFADAIFALERIMDVINFRIDHALEGWRKCGFRAVEWRPHQSALWLPSTELISEKFSAVERSAFGALIAANPLLKRERNLSPAEVFYPGAAKLKKLPDHVAALLMALIPPTSTEEECVVERGVLPVRVRELDQDEPLRFGLTRRDGRGTEEPLKTGEKYLVRVNGCDPSKAFLYHADGSFAGVANYHGRDSRDEIQTNHRQFAEKRKFLAAQTEDSRFVTSRVTRADINRTSANSTVVKSQHTARAEMSDAADEALARAMNTD